MVFEKIILKISYITLCKTDEPPNEAPIDPKGTILTIFVEDH